VTLQRRFGLALAALCSILGLSVTGSAAAASPIAAQIDAGVSGEILSAIRADGRAHLSSCLQSARTLSVLFLMDRSGSLNNKDPNGVRYQGMQTALEQLATLKRGDGKELSAEVAVSSFNGAYQSAASVAPWRRINGQDSRAAIAEVLRAAREQTSPEGGTNFEDALNGGLGDIGTRGDDRNCRVILWFTDGMFEESPDGVPAARARMCAPGGVVDSLHAAGVTIIGLQLKEQTLTDLEKMSVGVAADGPCGTTPIPEGWASGVYLKADDAAGLKRIFAEVTRLANGCTPTGDLGAVVDPGIRRMTIYVDTPRKSGSVRLDAPDGTAMDAPTSGEFGKGGYTTKAEADDYYFSMEIAFPPGKGTGQWRISPDVAVTPDQIHVSVCSDLHLSFDGAAPQVKAGLASPVILVATDPSGAPADLRAFAKVVPGASAKALSSTLPAVASNTPDGKVAVEVTPGPTDARFDLDVIVRLTTASGLQLTPITFKAGLAATLSSDVPLIVPADELTLSDVVKVEPGTGTLTLVGSPDGPTKVCLEEPKSINVPQDVAGTTLGYPRGCVELATNERRTVTVAATPPTATTGDGSAKIPVILHSAPTAGRASQAIPLELPVRWRFTDPLNVTVLWVLILVAAVLSLIPLAIIALANWVSTRYETRGLQHEIIPVRCEGSQISRVDPLPGAGMANRLADRQAFRPITGLGSSPKRDLSVGGVRLRSAVSLNPKRAARFWAEAPAGSVISTTAARGLVVGATAPTTASLDFLGILVVTEADLRAKSASTPATIVVLTRNGALQGEDVDGMLREAFGKRTLDAMARSLPNSATSGSRSPSKPSSGQPTPSGHGIGTQPPGTKRPLIGRENKKGTR